jgi:hypothetical protein
MIIREHAGPFIVLAGRTGVLLGLRQSAVDGRGLAGHSGGSGRYCLGASAAISSSALPGPGLGEDHAGKGCREGLASGDVMSRPLLTRSRRPPVPASVCGLAGGRRYQRLAWW